MRAPLALGLARASHAGPTAAVTAYCTATAAASGLGGRSALLGLAVLLGQLSVGWSNDWVDAPRDRARGRTTKPVVAGTVRRDLLGVAALLALAACAVVSFLLGWRPALVHLVAVASAWGYNAGLKATVLSPAPYVVSFGLVPVVMVAQALPGHPLPPGTLVLAAGLVGGAAHFTNAVKDLEDDRATGVLGLPQRLGVGASAGVSAAGVAVGAVAFAAVDGAGVVPLVAGALSIAVAGALLVAAARGAREVLFLLSVLAVAPLVAGIVAVGGVPHG